MEITHAEIDGYKHTIQLLTLLCPNCKHDVRCVIPEEDRIYRKDAVYLQKQCGIFAKEIERLNSIITALTALQE